MIFVEMIRMFLEEGLVEAGWLSALADPRISPAVRLLHLDPNRDWRLLELAKACNLSRSRFASRFTDTVGMSLIAYLTKWRMFLARKAFQDPRTTVAA
jgi:AraC-like DNA-binding protein